jgi:hypothetical protein
MAQPVWITPPGSLGTIPEGVFYVVPLQAYDPDSVDTVFFEVIAGQLPAGIQVINDTGLMAGVPQAIAVVDGVPAAVSGDITSKFVVRAYTKTILGTVKRLADRTFTLTVTGQNNPEFITPAGSVGTYFDGTQVLALPIEYTDVDPADTVVVRLAGGLLPPGLTISATGIISGFIAPNTDAGVLAGFSRDGQGFSQYPFDFSTRSSTVNYEFTLELTDGKSSNLRTFTILVYSRNSCTADNTQITADNTFVTADCTPTRTPIVLTPQGSLGTTRNDNFYAFQFQGLDLDGDQFSFISNPLTPVPGLTLDPSSGWLYGYIPNLGITELTYNFTVRAYKNNDPDVISPAYNYSINIVGNLSTEVTWLTASDLGSITNGSISTLYVEAVNRSGIPLQYRLESGSDSRLPQGLQLLPGGDIAGRVSFNTFALDSGTTTFDVRSNNLYNPNSNPTTGVGTETTFDLTYTFTVNAFSVNGVVSVFKTFTIRVIRLFNEPFDNLYIQAMPPQNDRALLNSLLQNNDIFPQSLLYRPQDPNFGRATQVIYQHAYGLTAATLDEYVNALTLNHYWKNLVLGSVETAQAVDDLGNVIYEVVYSRVIDNLVNNSGQSVSKEVTLAYPINAGDSTEIATVYPNSLVNMRTQVIDTVGQISNVLPRWMISKQADGSVLGFVPAWVIAYTKPGKSGQIKYNIQTQFGNQLNLVDFEADRYELDNLLTKNWDRETQQWIPTPPQAVTFDINNHYQLPTPNDSSFVFDGGIGYAVGDTIKILGSQVGGTNVLNDILLVVNTVDALGTIESVFATGTALLFSAGDTYTNIAGTNITGTGTGATWDIEVVPGTATVFDYGSVEFSVPVDVYTNTQIYDRYLLFPKRNILE